MSRREVHGQSGNKKLSVFHFLVEVAFFRVQGKNMILMTVFAIWKTSVSRPSIPFQRLQNIISSANTAAIPTPYHKFARVTWNISSFFFPSPILPNHLTPAHGPEKEKKHTTGFSGLWPMFRTRRCGKFCKMHATSDHCEIWFHPRSAWNIALRCMHTCLRDHWYLITSVGTIHLFWIHPRIGKTHVTCLSVFLPHLSAVAPSWLARENKKQNKTKT